MNMKFISFILLTLLAWTPLLRALDDTSVPYDVFRKPTCDPRITSISWAAWTNEGVNHLWGPVVPNGKTWIIEFAGVATYDPRAMDYMLQVAIMNPAGTGGYWLTPVARATKVNSTPVLALERRIVMPAGRAFMLRCNGIQIQDASDNIMALLFDGWEVDDDMLPYLLGLPPLTSSLSSEELARKQVMERRLFESQ